VKVAVLGAGFAGLAAAYDLARGGHRVTVLEAMDQPGGLAAGFRDERWDWPLERFYHHLFTSDAAIIGLAKETGFGGRLITRRPITASFYRGRPYALDGVMPVLTFPGIPFPDRVRLGLAIAYLKVTRNWHALETVPAEQWLRRWMGRAAYEVIWQPLLLGKFGPAYRDVPMSWLWARLHKRSMRLIYFDGGFQAFADHLHAEVGRRGVSVRLQTPVQAVRPAAGGGLSVDTPDGDEPYDRVICTTGPHLLARLVPSLPPDYLAGLQRLPYMGAVVAVLALDRQLMRSVYWLSMDKREFPFLACVEHTNFMGPSHYGGDRLVYLGDYLPPGHRLFALSEDEILAEWLPPLGRINPAFEPAWIRRSWLFKTGYAQPVVPLGFSKHIPPLATPIPGLYLASMSQVYPWDRGTNYAVEIGRQVAALVQAGGGAAGEAPRG
jgi:protoporphyrinogen oxidase